VPKVTHDKRKTPQLAFQLRGLHRALCQFIRGHGAPSAFRQGRLAEYGRRLDIADMLLGSWYGDWRPALQEPRGK